MWVILKEPYWCAIIAFALNTGAYTSEILDQHFKQLKEVILRQEKVLEYPSKIIFIKYKYQLPLNNLFQHTEMKLS